jgi:alkylation response protein AidB-like acyl-CoA dehydrogenase
LEGEAKKPKGRDEPRLEIDSLVEEEGWKWMMMMMEMVVMRVEISSCSFGVLLFTSLKN